ncbi:hypothetical protein F5Y05DRAFT_58457 [Hypoxylon sp. FL0543]|nr:hypothetical protein F5Y05DRAFT_58457 [Hypoxylon sp. FL0543]
MDKLPLEIRVDIVSFLPKALDGNGRPFRPGLASLSRAWQAAVEPVTFEKLHITSAEFPEFSAKFSNVNRRRFLKVLHFDIVLPAYSDSACAEYETDQDREANDRVASEAVSRLLHELATWPADLDIELLMGIYSPMDGGQRRSTRDDGSAVLVGTRMDIFDERYRYSYINLMGIEELQVPCVRSFTPPEDGRVINPASLVSLTTRFPALSRIDWHYDEPGPFSALRKRLRDDFAAALGKFKLSSEMKVVDIVVLPPTYPHNRRLPDLTGRSPNDLLCTSLNGLLCESSIHQLFYKGLVDASFWSTNPDQLHSNWTSIKDIVVEFDYASPSGKWYFRGSVDDRFNVPASDEPLPASTTGLWHFPPGYGTEADTVAALVFARTIEPHMNEDGQWRRFRWIPNNEVMVPMLEAFARRLASTPSLQYAHLARELFVDPREWFISYGAPGCTCGFEEYLKEPEVGLSRARVFFHVDGWVPERRLVDLFRDIGKRRHGQDAIITFLPFLY